MVWSFAIKIKILISIKILQNFKSWFPSKKLKFDLDSWFAMNFKQVCLLYHDFPPFEDL